MSSVSFSYSAVILMQENLLQSTNDIPRDSFLGNKLAKITLANIFRQQYASFSETGIKWNWGHFTHSLCTISEFFQELNLHFSPYDQLNLLISSLAAA